LTRRKVHDEELHDLHFSAKITTVLIHGYTDEHVAYERENRNIHRVLMRKPEGKRPLIRPRSRMENINWILKEAG